MSSARVSSLIDVPGALAWVIRESGVSQADIARATGYSEKHISQMMTGRAIGSLHAWQALIEAADVSVDVRIKTR